MVLCDLLGVVVQVLLCYIPGHELREYWSYLVCLSGWCLLNPRTKLLEPNLAWWCIIRLACDAKSLGWYRQDQGHSESSKSSKRLLYVYCTAAAFWIKCGMFMHHQFMSRCVIQKHWFAVAKVKGGNWPLSECLSILHILNFCTDSGTGHKKMAHLAVLGHKPHSITMMENSLLLFKAYLQKSVLLNSYIHFNLPFTWF